MSIPLKLTRAEVGVLQRNFRTKRNLLDSLGLDGGEILSRRTDQEPETVSAFLRRKGMSADDVAEFERRCREDGAEDDGNGPLGEALSALQQFIIEKLQPEDAETCNSLIGSLLEKAGNGGGATDDIPTYRSNGTPRNNAGAMDSQIASGPRDVFGAGVDLRTVRIPAARAADDRSFLARFPEAGRIRQQWDR
jgi:hypothetical protein